MVQSSPPHSDERTAEQRAAEQRQAEERRQAEQRQAEERAAAERRGDQRSTAAPAAREAEKAGEGPPVTPTQAELDEQKIRARGGEPQSQDRSMEPAAARRYQTR